MSNVTFKGSPVALSGTTPNVGQTAPEVELVAKDLSSFKVGGANSKSQILITVPSLDTGVCATETRKFNEKLAGMGNVEVNVISMDLPFAMGRFCTTEGIENLRVGSDFKKAKFGLAYGLLLENGPLEGLLARAVFVIDKNGVIVYKEVVSEVTNEPNYEAAIKALIDGGSCGCGCGH